MAETATDRPDVPSSLEQAFQDRFGVGVKESPGVRNQMALGLLQERLKDPSLTEEQRAEYAELQAFFGKEEDLTNEERQRLRSLTQALMLQVLQRKRVRRRVKTEVVEVTPKSIEVTSEPQPEHEPVAESVPLPDEDPADMGEDRGYGHQGIVSSSASDLLRIEIARLYGWPHLYTDYEQLEQMSLKEINQILKDYEKFAAMHSRVIIGLEEDLEKHHLPKTRQGLFVFRSAQQNMQRLHREKSPKARLYQITDELEALIEGEWPIEELALRDLENKHLSEFQTFPLSDELKEHYEKVYVQVGETKELARSYSQAESNPDFEEEKLEYFIQFARLYLYRLHYRYGIRLGEEIIDEIKQQAKVLEKEIERYESSYLEVIATS